ncbi:hypothetical protein BDK51DRAFT_40605 [Blyttiomyces helicus]|uniref:Uncharacterized protein n=1 Tax=Blyttiomyces helicus TaxID=388810 RepID=A0A4P9VWZ6_9FUNG|nr:hypothetical protein BDK51DRAFT_40605 [Blyttiomyces helicus]|eukprot:RKO82788.1 hypothetical protein BDK51DRAFT_40605 [Blyttiomyces helicus]
MDIVKANPHIEWDFPWMAHNPHLTMDFVNENLDKPWDYSRLSMNDNLKIEFTEANRDKPWDFARLSMNLKITMEIVNSNPDKPWDWRMLSSNPNITIEMVQSNPEKPWNYEGLCCNPNIIQYLLDEKLYWLETAKHSEQCHFYKYLSGNPSLTVEFVQANPDKPWDFREIARNCFHYEKPSLPVISIQRRMLLDELNDVFDMPPNCNSRRIFQKGGVGFHEWMHEFISLDLLFQNQS